MKLDFSRSVSTLALLTAPLVLSGLTGCGNLPYIAGAAQSVNEQADLQTGSNLTRHDKSSMGVRELDRDALESSVRGINANRDNGK